MGTRSTVVVVGLLARQLVAWGRPGESGRRAGLAAATVAAVYPGLWINDGMLLSESAAILAITLTTAAAYAFWHRPSWRRAGLLGFVAGIAADYDLPRCYVEPVQTALAAWHARNDWKLRFNARVDRLIPKLRAR